MYNNICLKGVIIHHMEPAHSHYANSDYGLLFYSIDFDILSPVSLNMNR